MNIMLKLFVALKSAYIANKDGATAIEYGLIAAGISLAIAAVVFTFGEDLLSLFENMEGKLETAVTSSSGTGG
jgi:pilus assembly protein Flp/PilA